MRVLQALVRRVRRFGLRRSAGVYLIIVAGLLVAGELAVEHIVRQSESPAFALFDAFVIAVLAGLLVFFLFQGAVEDRKQAGIALENSEERFRSLTSLRRKLP